MIVDIAEARAKKAEIVKREEEKQRHMHVPKGRIVTSHRTCEYHQRHPQDRAFPGCTCSGSYVFTTTEEPEDEAINAARDWLELPFPFGNWL